MPIARTIFATVSTIAWVGLASAQQVVVKEPVPDQFEGIVRAQHIKPGDVSEEEYAKLLEEADKVRTFRRSYLAPEGSKTEPTYFPEVSTTSDVIAPPANTKIQVLESPPTQSATLETPADQLENATTHMVVKGDTLYNISQRYGVTLKQLKAANKIPDNTIKLGQLLMIPGTATGRITESIALPARPTLVRTVEPVPVGNIYAVLPGDTLYSISKRACLTVAQLALLNNISDVASLSPGQRITLPAGHCLR